MARRSTAEWYADVPRNARSFTLLGFSGLFIALAGFGYWGGTAPIAGAVVTTGAFVATGQNRIVQHLEGGVIHEIKVREGDLVEAGQPLVVLDDTTPRAELRRLDLRLARLIATEARLQAEAEDRDAPTVPDELVRRTDDADIALILASQQLTFAARRKSLESDIAQLRAGVDALDQRIEGSTRQRRSVERQLTLVREELAGKEVLLRSGLVRKPEVLAVDRTREALEGEVGRLTGEIGDARERVSRTLEQIQSARNAYVKAAVDQLQEVSAELHDVRERLRAAQRVLERIVIAAPVRGIVVKMRYHTEGGVIEPGKNILEIVPVHEELIIEVRVRPQDIDHVKQGQTASVRLTALNRRTTPMVAGEVVYVSADAVPDESRRQTPATSDVYVARVRLKPEEAAAVPGFSPAPGMPAEVFIKTAERTFFEYLMQPIRDSLSRAFREA